jgi:hypothetical protein
MVFAGIGLTSVFARMRGIIEFNGRGDAGVGV